jgi:hypothetical protein
MAEVPSIHYSPSYFNNRPYTSTIITHVIINRHSKKSDFNAFAKWSMGSKALE